MPSTVKITGDIAFKKGTTTALQSVTLPDGTLAIDKTKKTFRIGDGSTVGGTEIAVGLTPDKLLVWQASPDSSFGSYNELNTVSLSVAAVSVFKLPVSYTITSGALPLGLSLNASTGAITGTMPNLDKTTKYTFIVQANDTITTIARQFTITVNALNDSPVWVTQPSLGTISDSMINIQLNTTDADSSLLTYSLTGGALPSNVTLNPSGLISGLNPVNGTLYTFTVSVNDGVNSVSRTFTMTCSTPGGESIWTTPGSYSFTVPAGVYSVSAVGVLPGNGGSSAAGGHGGAGGGLMYGNNISVVPGEVWTIVVGSGGAAGGGIGTKTGIYRASSGSTVMEILHNSTDPRISVVGTNGDSVWKSYSGGDGGVGGAYGGGGGGAGGYNGWGGYGGDAADTAPAIDGTGGGGGGGARSAMAAYNVRSGNGGGVGLYGIGNNGTKGCSANNGVPSIYNENPHGKGGSSGADGVPAGPGNYGGGGAGNAVTAGSPACAGAPGAVRIIWGSGRTFPNNAA